MGQLYSDGGDAKTFTLQSIGASTPVEVRTGSSFSFKLNSTNIAQLGGANDVRIELGNVGTYGTNDKCYLKLIATILNTTLLLMVFIFGSRLAVNL